MNRIVSFKAGTRGKQRRFVADRTKAVFRYEKGRFFEVQRWTLEHAGVLIGVDARERLCIYEFPAAVPQEAFDHFNDRQVASSVTTAWTEDGDTVVIAPDSVYCEASRAVLGGTFEKYAIRRRVSPNSFTLTVRQRVDPLEVLVQLGAREDVVIVEPEVLSFTRLVETPGHEVVRNVLGDWTFKRKMPGSDVSYEADGRRYVVVYRPTLKAPAKRLEEEGFTVECLDVESEMALVSVFGKASVKRTTSASVEAMLDVCDRADRRGSGVKAVFPVLRDSHGNDVVIRPYECVVRIKSGEGLDSVSFESAIGLLGSLRLSIVRNLDRSTLHCRHRGDSPQDFLTSLRKLANCEWVVYAEPVFASFAPLEAENRPILDPLFSRQWNIKDCGAVEAWELERGVDGVAIVVIDTGVDMTHPDLVPSLVSRGAENWNFAGPSDEPSGSPHETLRSHGTMVSGIAVAAHNAKAIVGVAPGCGLIPLRVLNGGLLLSSTLIEALLYVVSYAERHPEKRLVVNMSLQLEGGVFSEGCSDAIRRGSDVGVVYVASRGNRPNASAHYPSGYDQVISVGATGPDDIVAVGYTGLGGSDPASKVDIVAPGGAGVTPLDSPENIIGLDVGGAVQCSYGTSLAAPLVAGAAALLLSYAIRNKKSLSSKDVLHLLKNGADPIDLANAATIGKIGAGRLNIRRSLELVSKLP